MRATLNIGHDIPQGGFLQHCDILTVLRAYGLTVEKARIAHSPTELTTVVVVSADRATTIIGGVYCAAVTLGQECIAVNPHGIDCPRLVGPDASAWGDFDSTYFIQA